MRAIRHQTACGASGVFSRPSTRWAVVPCPAAVPAAPGSATGSPARSGPAPGPRAAPGSGPVSREELFAHHLVERLHLLRPKQLLLLEQMTDDKLLDLALEAANDVQLCGDGIVIGLVGGDEIGQRRPRFIWWRCSAVRLSGSCQRGLGGRCSARGPGPIGP